MVEGESGDFGRFMGVKACIIQYYTKPVKFAVATSIPQTYSSCIKMFVCIMHLLLFIHSLTQIAMARDYVFYPCF